MRTGKRGEQSVKDSEETRARERQMKKATYEYCKAKGICVICRKEPAFYNRVRCPSCMEKAAAQQARRTANLTQEQREKINRQKRERYSRNKAEGRCTNCGKVATNGYALCPTCLIQQRRAGERYRMKNKKGYIDAGTCIWCGAERAEGYKMCPTCLERNRELMAHARQFAPKDRPWERSVV